MQPQVDYDELMINCLRCSGGYKKEAIQLFHRQFPDTPWMYAYAYKVYERVMFKANPAEKALASINKLLHNIEVAVEKTLKQGVDMADWGPFLETAKLQTKILNLDKTGQGQNPLIAIQQNTNHFGNMSYEELMSDVHRLYAKVVPGGAALPGTVTVPAIPAGFGTGQSSQPTPAVQAQPQAGYSVPVGQQVDMGVWRQPGG